MRSYTASWVSAATSASVTNRQRVASYALYERTARVVDGRVSVLVPRDRVDDFLKSLTVVDPTTRKPLAVSIPRQAADGGSYLTMSLETQDAGQGSA